MTPVTTPIGFDVIYVGPLSPPNRAGAAILASELLARVARAGHTVRALAPMLAAELGSGPGAAARHPEIEVTWYPIPVPVPDSFKPPPEEYREAECRGVQQGLRRLVAGRRPDLVLIGRETLLGSVLPLTEGLGVPSVLWAQGGVLGAVIGETYPEPHAREVLALCRRVDLIVTVAAHRGEALRGLGLGEVRVIPNPVDLRAFRPRRKDRAILEALDAGTTDVLVMHLSNLRAVKRPLDLVASAEVALRCEPRLLYVVVGDGDLRPETERACRDRGVAGRFRFTGWVDHTRVPALINAADIVVMPSESEALPLAYLEAQACGRVLLASDIPAAREVIVDGGTGLLFPPGDIGRLAARTLEAARDPARRAALGRRARRSVAACAYEAVVRRYEEVLRCVARRRS